MGSFNVKKWTNAVTVKYDIKTLQHNGITYKTWVAIKPSGLVLAMWPLHMHGWFK